MMFDHELPVGGPGGRMFDNHFTTNEGYPDWLTTNPKIVEETEQAKARCRKEKELSTYRKVRLSHIFDELRDIFNAEMVALVSSEPTIGEKTDYTIRIYNGDIDLFHKEEK